MTNNQAHHEVDYLLLSDIHLGSDLVTQSRPWAATTWLLQEPEVDRRLVAMLDHYREHRAEGRRWKLIIAGDFLDLVGVALPARGETLRTKPTAEEELHGLGSAADHVLEKMRAIVARHRPVFEALCRFVADDNSLVVVRGNHDIELHWHVAQRALVEAIVAHAPSEARSTLAARIEICPWFYAVDGLLYVEHGHEFDAMCSYGDPLVPTCLRDSRRIRSTPFSVLLRHVARPTRGLSSASYGYVGMGAYVVLLMQLGVRGSWDIAVRYTRACSRLIAECFARAVDGGLHRMRRTKASLRRFAKKTGVSTERLEALRALYVSPAVQSVRYVMSSLYLDRIAAGALALTLFAATALIATLATLSAALFTAIPALLLAVYAVVGYHKNTSPKAEMRRGADSIARMFHARWVVMGHTHEPVRTTLAEDATYVNLGSWGQDDPPDEQVGGHPSSSTFLVLRGHDGRYDGELLQWDVATGPRPLRSAAPTSAAA